MAGYMGIGIMAAFAVSGSVVLIARQLHKRLLSDFMKQMEFELEGSRRSCQDKKRVRFADDVMEPSSNNKEYRRRRIKISTGNTQVENGGHCSRLEPLCWRRWHLTGKTCIKKSFKCKTHRGYNCLQCTYYFCQAIPDKISVFNSPEESTVKSPAIVCPLLSV